jgi:hypothetical protein
MQRLKFRFILQSILSMELSSQHGASGLTNCCDACVSDCRIRTQEAHRGDELEIWKNNPIRRDSHRPSRSIVARLRLIRSFSRCRSVIASAV